jgi:5-methylcytosine-specific restriction endonuclease McrA
MSQKHDKQRIYNSKEWKIIRAAKLQRSPLCEVCKSKGLAVSARAVHHIIPIETATSFEEMKQLAFRYTNLMSVCYTCHSEIHEALRSRSREGHQRSSEAALQRWIEKHEKVVAHSEGKPSPVDLPEKKK